MFANDCRAGMKLAMVLYLLPLMLKRPGGQLADGLALFFVFFFAADIALRVIALGWSRFWRRSQDQSMQLTNR